jgi:hypothetical protein
MLLLATQLHRLGDAKGCRDAHRGVSSAKVVVWAFGHAWEATYATALAVVDKGVTTTCDNLMCIGLVSHIPNYAVVGRVVYMVQCHGELHSAEARAEVTRVYGATLENVVAYIVDILPKFANTHAAQRLGGVYIIQVFICVISCHIISIKRGDVGYFVVPTTQIFKIQIYELFLLISPHIAKVGELSLTKIRFMELIYCYFPRKSLSSRLISIFFN